MLINETQTKHIIRRHNTMSNVVEVTDTTFEEEVLKSDIPVIVDFWAPWCMPCRMISPIVDELAKDYKGKIKFVKINVDNNTQLATDLQILSIPLLILFKNGREILRKTGANPKEYIQKEIESALQ